MNIIFSNKENVSISFVFEDEQDHFFFQAKLGEVFADTDQDLLLGLGKKEEFNRERLQEALFKLGQTLKTKGIHSLALPSNPFEEVDSETYLLDSIEALYLSQYRFDYYKDQKEGGLTEIYLPEDFRPFSSQIQEFLNLLDSQKISRDLVNIRSNDLTPRRLAEEVEDIFSDLDVTLDISGPEAIRDKGLTAFLEVARGSEEEPRFIVMEYNQGKEGQAPLVFVGKGITYDTGGYSLKPSKSMDTMHCDMGGAGTVIGAIRAIASNQLPVHVVGIIAATENAVSGKAYKPGDVIRARNGMTIEVENTDAEGRLTLADAVHYGIDRYQPQLLVDLATLTGAALSALGETYTASVTNQEEAHQLVQEAADQAGEKIWQLPNDPYFKKSFQSDVADLKNTGGALCRNHYSRPIHRSLC